MKAKNEVAVDMGLLCLPEDVVRGRQAEPTDYPWADVAEHLPPPITPNPPGWPQVARREDCIPYLDGVPIYGVQRAIAWRDGFSPGSVEVFSPSDDDRARLEEAIRSGKDPDTVAWRSSATLKRFHGKVSLMRATPERRADLRKHGIHL